MIATFRCEENPTEGAKGASDETCTLDSDLARTLAGLATCLALQYLGPGQKARKETGLVLGELDLMNKPV